MMAIETTTEHSMYGQLDDEDKFILLQKSTEKIQLFKELLFDTLKDMFQAPDKDELFHICWGYLESYTPGDQQNLARALVTLATLVALHTKTGRVISPRRAQLVVRKAVECNGATITFRDEDESLSYEYHSKDPMGGAVFLLGLTNLSIVDALIHLLMDKNANHHGRSNAGGVLMRLAFANPFQKQRIVEALAASVGDDSDLSKSCRSHLVEYLAILHAEEAREVVGEACQSGKLDYEVCGYSDFIVRLGQDTHPDDPYATTTIVRRLDEMFKQGKRVREGLSEVSKGILETNDLQGCDHCHKQPQPGEKFPTCSACQQVSRKLAFALFKSLLPVLTFVSTPYTPPGELLRP